MKLALALALTLSTLATHAAADPLPASAFAYDEKAPFDLRDEAPPQKRGDVTVRDVTFKATTASERTRAYLVLPKEAASYSGALWVHWLGEKNANRDEFLGDAVELAQSGTLSLLVDAQWSAPKWFRARTTETDYDASVRQVKDLRRALDLLLAQKGVDRNRLAYVGHDFGGMYGSIVAGVDGRPQIWVILAVTTKLTDWFLLGKPPANKPEYLAKMAPLEPVQYLARAKPKAVFFQFAKTDEYVTKEHAEEYVAAVKGEKKVVSYEADHDLDVPAAHADRIAWLKGKL